jgi:hypothetical protein
MSIYFQLFELRLISKWFIGRKSYCSSFWVWDTIIHLLLVSLSLVSFKLKKALS